MAKTGKGKGRKGMEIPEGAMSSEELWKVFEWQEKNNSGSDSVQADKVHAGPVFPEEKKNVLQNKLAEIEEKIETEFSDAEKKFIEPMVGEYEDEFWKAKRRKEEKDDEISDKWVSAFRQSFINTRKRWGLDRQIAPEKSSLLEKYLELKLPLGIPEERTENIIKKKENMEIRIKNGDVEESESSSQAEEEIRGKSLDKKIAELEREIENKFPSERLSFIVDLENFSKKIYEKIRKDVEEFLEENIPDSEKKHLSLTILKSVIFKKYSEYADSLSLPRDLAGTVAEFVTTRIRSL